MANNVITTALLIIAGVTGVVILMGAVFPAIFQMTGTLGSIADDMSEKMLTNVSIVFTRPEGKVIHLWLKNTGKNEILPDMIEYSDISIVSNSKISKDRYIHVPYKESAKGKPYWTYSFENKNNGDYWGKGDTIKVEVCLKRSLGPGSYTIRFTTYNGFTASDVFSTGRR